MKSIKALNEDDNSEKWKRTKSAEYEINRI